MIVSKLKKSKKESCCKTDYPRLKKSMSTQAVVLFTENCTGYVVHCDNGWDIGHFSKTWAEDNFKDYNDKIILSNKD